MLIVGELAMTTMLMVGAGLLIRTLWSVQHIDPGFAPAGVLKAEYSLPITRYPQDQAKFPNWPERIRFHDELVSRIQTLPGVQAVGLGGANPLDAGFTSSIAVVGREAEARDWPEPSIRTVSPSYFQTLRVPLMAGRSLEAGDDPTRPPVVVINDAANRRFFDGRNALGQQIRLWGASRTVVGVVGSERINGLTEPSPPALYLPVGQAPITGAVMIRTTGDPRALIPALRRIVQDLDPQLPLFGVEPLAETLGNSQAQRRFTMILLVAFASVAMLLAIVGVHGVLSYSVAQRTREIGIRVALGADLARIRELVLTQGARLVAIGVVLGLVLALGLTRLLTSVLFGVGARDPLTFTGVAGVLALVALVACWLPARRAAKVDPMVALRHE
jgi:predicted permease